MLDIYYTDPSTNDKPDDPSGLELAGSIELDAHRSLAVLFDKGSLAGAGLRYFEDSFLQPAQIATLMKVFTANVSELGSNREALEAFEAMRSLFEAALTRGAGLVAFCD
ncbi:hypothetical protein [Pseudoxanthomonas sacheonensis]|uniref:hypothetical protein n=1 Tax=Pseudoxanthomonas sacheonensis TaxID=443615 RepID=UPI0013D19A0C|nr:hypothetical protein [Pseudoxanthomonas sacheonensis]KAF1705885.1 hypothetical protein CSC73_18095 [Pseudoxanthomonas sacheonensis]